MRSTLVQIGNSRGVRIPKAFLQEAKLENEIEIELTGEQILIRAARHARDGWDQAFAAMAARGDDSLLDARPQSPTGWDETEWQW